MILFIYMSTHRPSEDQFYSWLLNEYKIDCQGSMTCTKKLGNDSSSILIETGSNIKNGYLLFNTVGKIYEDQNGSRTTIKAMGVLGNYFTIMKEDRDKKD
ncbi:hypothetical protein HF072_15875 [Bacillus sp. RO3]|nr:hypothetical protein [Bacillus sp. RO3]